MNSDIVKMKNWLEKFTEKVENNSFYEPIDLLDCRNLQANIIDDRYVLFDEVKLDIEDNENSADKEISEEDLSLEYCVLVKVVDHKFPSFGTNLFVKFVYDWNSWDSNQFKEVKFCTYIPVTEYKFVDVKLGD
jgi:hypothetical protein